MERIITALDNQPLVDIGEYRFIVNPLTEQVPATDAALLREACTELAQRVNTARTTKLLSEEDKGAIFVAGVSMITNLPFGMARWQPNGLAQQITESFAMEYHHGTLYLNGIDRGDQVTILDDLISTGGTLLSLIRMVERAGAEIIDILCIAEKINYGGVARVKKETGHVVQTLVQIDVSGERSRVVTQNI